MFRETIKRNYELEELLYGQTAKMKPAKENPLKILVGENEENQKELQINAKKFEPKIDLDEDEDDEAGGIREKVKTVSYSAK